MPDPENDFAISAIEKNRTWERSMGFNMRLLSMKIPIQGSVPWNKSD